MRIVSFKIEPQVLEELDRYAMRHGLARSEAIRLAIERLVRSELEEDKKLQATIEKGAHL